MNATQLLTHFDRLAEAPDAVPRLRQFLLDLAVRGKLVERDAADQPAAEFLKRIHGHKAALVKAGNLKIQPVVLDVPLSKQPYQLRTNWKWASFGTVMISRDGERIPIAKEERNSRAKLYDYYGASGVIDKIDGFLFDKPLLLIGEDGANLVNRSTPIAFIARGQYWVNNHAHVLDAITEDFLKYVELFINAIDLIKYVTGTAQPKMNQAKMNSIPVAVPPEAEQRRIVAKVDELMALCDQLESAQQERERRRDRLAAASLQRLNQLAEANPATDQSEPAEARQQAQREQQKDHARFHLQNLHRLTTRPEHIKAMREVVLDAAFQGTLTPQNVCDGDGIELLERVVQHSLKGVVTAKVKSAKSATAIGVEVTPAFPTPRTWTWAPLQLMCEQIGDIDHKMPRAVDIGVPFLSARDLKDGGLLDFSNPKYISEEDFARLSRKVLPRRNDIVYSRIGARLGKARLVEVDTRFLISYSCCLIRPKHEFIDKRYLQIFLDSHLALQQAHFGVQSIGVPDLGLGEIKAYRIPLPPLAEQHRIVAKVDELMALCEQLEARLTQSQTDSRRLLEAVLEATLAPA